MLNVSDATKSSYLKDGVHKTLRVYFPELNLTVSNDKIVKNSMSLSESICSGSSIEFVGCISSSLRIKLYDINEKLKGKKIELYIKADGTSEEIPLFKGIVDSATIQAERAFKEITAYDILYTKGQTEVAGWYNSLHYPVTLGSIRKSLISAMGLPVVEIDLPNDGIVIPEKKFNNVESMKALTVLKSICQANGCFGMVNRDGKFEFKYLLGAYDRLFPSVNTIPSANLFPVSTSNDGRIGYVTFDAYKSLEYQEYTVKPVDRVQIRDTDEDGGVIYGGNTGNKYIIQSNMFAYELPDSTAMQMAANILGKIKDISFHPCNVENRGLPFVECGDIVTYPIQKHYGEKGNYNVNTFLVLSRTLKGDQILTDSYTSEGEEEQSEFITNIQAQLDAIRRSEPDMTGYYTADEVDDLVNTSLEDYPTIEDTSGMINDQVMDLKTPTGWTVQSVSALPSNRSANTIYFIRGGMIIL